MMRLCLEIEKSAVATQHAKFENRLDLFEKYHELKPIPLFLQVYHYCHHDGRQDSFLCPKGTVFNQKVFVCDWWYNADCGGSTGFYSLNEDLYSVKRYQLHTSD